MRSFSHYFFEDIMTVGQAMKIFGYSQAVSKETIKQDFKKLALKYHPDRGGSATKMAEINNAYELLMKQVGITNKKDTETERMEAMREVMCLKALSIYKIQAQKIGTLAKKLCDFYNKTSNNRFSFSPVYSLTGKDWSHAPETNIWNTMYNQGVINKNYMKYTTASALYSVVWELTLTNPSGDVKFEFGIVTSVEYPKTNAIEASFETPITIAGNAFVNNRKQIVFGRTWKNQDAKTNTREIFEHPENVFLSDKITKILSGGGRTKSNSKFSKKDAESYVTSILGGELRGIYVGSIQVPIIKKSITQEELKAYGVDPNGRLMVQSTLDSYLKHGTMIFDMRRVVLERVPFWDIGDIVIHDIINGEGLLKRRLVHIQSKSMYRECEELFIGIKKVQDKYKSLNYRDGDFDKVAKQINNDILKECKPAEVE